MNYLDRIREIQRNFTMGFLDRESSLVLFEDLLHEYGLLPVEEQLDRTITNENFLALLRLAQEHRGAKSSRDPEVSKEIEPPDPTSIVKAYAKDLDRIGDMMGLNRDRYRIADSIIQNCPICKAKCAGLYNRMQSLDNQVIPVDPPRCQKCMMKWVEEKFGLGVHSKVAEAPPSASIDDSLVKPLDEAETDFFKLYEKQMEEYPPGSGKF
jgi:hypothetical protein